MTTFVTVTFASPHLLLSNFEVALTVSVVAASFEPIDSKPEPLMTVDDEVAPDTAHVTSADVPDVVVTTASNC
jgi:hypothetical protein